jgi:TetR/AcrR family transcriptional regulator, mexJK operon transcriptional repressor
MPQRDDNDFERRRQQIIDGALQVFASKGFETATTKDIAEAAGIKSPGLIYHYFTDKADLFRHVIEQRVPVIDLFDHLEAFSALPPREALNMFARGLLGATDSPQTVAMMRLIAGESIRHPGVAEMLNRLGPGRGFAFMRGYMERQMEIGTLRRMASGVAVRCFVGPLLAFIMTKVVFPQPDTDSLLTETMAVTAVDVFLRGMEPDDA